MSEKFWQMTGIEPEFEEVLELAIRLMRYQGFGEVHRTQVVKFDPRFAKELQIAIPERDSSVGDKIKPEEGLVIEAKKQKSFIDKMFEDRMDENRGGKWLLEPWTRPNFPGDKKTE